MINRLKKKFGWYYCQEKNTENNDFFDGGICHPVAKKGIFIKLKMKGNHLSEGLYYITLNPFRVGGLMMTDAYANTPMAASNGFTLIHESENKNQYLWRYATLSDMAILELSDL